MARTLTISSGKGGVGKTNLCANLAIQLSAMGHRTCIFDADLGLANINIVLGLYPEHTIEDVILKDFPLSDIIIRDYHGIDIIPGSSGVEQIANIAPDKTHALINSFEKLDPYDFILFDTSAGISKNVVSFCLASSEIITVITPEPTSLTDAYALVKVLSLNGLDSPVKVIVNQCKDTNVARQTYSRFKEVVKKYLAIDVQALGFVLEDPNISDAVKQQQPFIGLYPSTIATKCIRVIANNLSSDQEAHLEPADADSFWKRFVGYFKSRLDLGHGLKDQDAPAPDAPQKEDEQPVTKAEPGPEQTDAAVAAAEEESPENGPVSIAEPLPEDEPVPDQESSDTADVIETASVSPAEAMEVAQKQPLDDHPPIAEPPASNQEAAPEPAADMDATTLDVQATGVPEAQKNVPVYEMSSEDTSTPDASDVVASAREESDAPPQSQAPVADETLEVSVSSPSNNETENRTTSTAPPSLMLDGDMLSLMDRLVTSISSISDEVKLLRTAVEGNGHLKAAPDPEKAPQKAIPLDFEAFLRSRTETK